MSRELDERIVAMYFDNKNFEKNAQQTIRTLEELKQSTNMDGVEKGFEAFAQAEKKMSLTKLNDSAKTLKNTFSGLGTVLQKSLNVATAPLQSVRHLFNEINGYVTKVAGIDIAGKIVNGVESALRSLTIAPISAGWNQYENTMDSVKTIMSSTGETIDTVKDKLAFLTEYANQTVYSLNDMTSNIGKFTNNGVKLEDATQAMIGLANATADAGQGAAQASMAMYNVSQAIGVGKMTTIDWKSLENANIATTKLKQTFIDAAVVNGQLNKKIVKNAQTGEDEIQYWTKAEKGAAAMQVTVENFRETLSKGWLDKESMMKTFAIFSGTMSELEIKALGFSDEEAARLYNIGQEAWKAATEVRTFSKMMDALKESVQSSWATSFEYIFGDMQEGTKLWTELNDKIDKVLTKGSEERNAILLSWRGMMKDENGNVRRIQEVYETRQRMLEVDLENGYIDAAEYNKRLKLLQDSLGDSTLWTDYRETAIGAFLDLFDVIQSVTSMVKGAWTDVFGSFDANALKSITQGFRDFVTRIQEWLGSADRADSRISKLRKGLSGIFSIIKIGITAVKSVIEVGWSVVKPFIDPLLNLFAKFGEWMNLGAAKNLGEMIQALGDKFKGLWDKLVNLGWKGVFEKIGNWISGLWEKLKNSISEWLTNNGLQGVVDWFVGIGDSIKAGYEAVKSWWEDDKNEIANFFRGIWEAVTGLFKVQEGEEETPIVAFFTGLWKKIDEAFQTLRTEWEQSGIPQFFEGMWDSIVSLFQPVVVTGKMGNTWVQNSPIVQFFVDLWSGIESAYNDLKTWWEKDSGIPKFFSDMWDSIVGLFQPVVVTGKMGNTWVQNSPIVQFFVDLWEGIKSVYQTLSDWWYKESGIPEFFADMWAMVSGWFSGTDAEGNQITPPIVKFLQDIWTGVTTAWTNIVSWEGWPAIGKFFSDFWGWLIGLFKGSGESSAGADSDKVPKELDNAETVASAITETMGLITDVNKEGEKIAGETEKNAGLFEQIGEFFSGIFKSLADAVTSIGNVPEVEAIIGGISSIMKIIVDLIVTVSDWLSRIATGVDRNGNKLNGWTDYGIPIIGALAVVVTKIFEYKKIANLATIAEASGWVNSFGGEFLKLAGGIALIAVAVRYLGTMSLEDLAKGTGAVVIIGIIFAELIKKLTGLSETLGNDNPVKSWERVVGKLISWAGMAGMLWILMEKLPPVLDALAKAKESGGVVGDDVLKVFESIILTLAGAMVALAVVSKIAPKGIDPVATIKTMISVMAAVLIAGGALFGAGALLDLLGADPEDIKKKMAIVAAFLEGLGDAVNALFRGLLGTTHAEQMQEKKAEDNLEHSKQLLGYLSEISEGFDSAKLTSISQMMGTIKDLTVMAEGVDSKNLVNFSGAIDYLVTGLLKFSELFTGKHYFDDAGELKYLNGFVERGSYKWQQFMDAFELINKFFEALEPVGSIANKGVLSWFESAFVDNGGKGVQTFIAGMNNIIDAAGGLHDASGIQFDGIAIVRKFYESIEDVWNASSDSPDLPKLNGAPIVNAIIDSIVVGDYAIKTAVKNMVQDGINLLGEETGKGTASQFDLSSIMGGLDWSNYFTLPDVSSYSEAVGDITEELAGEMESKTNAVSDKMKTGVQLKISGIDLSDSDENGIPDFIENIKGELEDLQTIMDTDDSYALSIRPVFNLDNMGEEMGRLREFFNSDVPLALNTSVLLGDQRLPIDDTNVVNALGLIRTDMNTNNYAMMTALGTAVTTLGTRINELGNDIASMKLYLDSDLLVGGISGKMDSALFKRINYASKTGVSSIP